MKQSSLVRHIALVERIGTHLLAILCLSDRSQGNAGFGYCSAGFSSTLARENLLVAGLPGVQQSFGKNRVAFQPFYLIARGKER